MDPEQAEALRAYDQRMFHWVNTNQLPLQGMKMQTLKLISDIFGGRTVTTGEVVWTPDMKARKLTRVLVTGKAIAGAKQVDAKPVDSNNEFDVDLSSREGEALRSSCCGVWLAEGGGSRLHSQPVRGADARRAGLRRDRRGQEGAEEAVHAAALEVLRRRRDELYPCRSVAT